MSTAVARRLVEFVSALREKGITAGPSETIDAAEIVDLLGLSHRERLREGLAAAFVRRGGQRDLFDDAFDLYFPLGVGVSAAADTDDTLTDVDSIRAALTEAMARSDQVRMRQLAEMSLESFGRVGDLDTDSGGWSAQQTLDAIGATELIVDATAWRERLLGRGTAADATARGQDLSASVTRAEIRNEVATFGAMVAAAARRRTSEVRGRERIAQHAIRPSTGEIDFLSADREALEAMRKEIAPLARKLAARLSAKRRRRRRGTIDIRRTLRKSMGTGGVPLVPVYERPHRRKPDLVLMCDVSGSVAGFSSFTMLLVKALSEQFSKVKVFAYVNAVADVTEIVNEERDNLTREITKRARVSSWHTSSDYGASFEQFAAEHLSAVGPRSSVLILGDARNNNLSPGREALEQIVARARRAYWLNPERSVSWGSGDSIATEYAEVVEMHEVRTMNQLSTFISRLLPA